VWGGGFKRGDGENEWEGEGKVRGGRRASEGRPEDRGRRVRDRAKEKVWKVCKRE